MNRQTFRIVSWIPLAAIILHLHSDHVFADPARVTGQEVEEFFTAIQMGDTNALAMLEANTNLVFVSENFSKLPLLEAAAAGNTPLLKRLIELGADINAGGDTRMSGGSKNTALHWAIYRNHPDAVKCLLEAGADPNRMAFNFDTTLHLAFSEGREEIAGWLLDYGAQPFQGKLYSNDETTPFEMDITKSNGRLVPRMLGQDSQPPLGTKSLQKPRRSNRPSHGMKTAAEVLAKQGSALLESAATRGELEAIAALFKAGVTVSNATDALTVMQAFALASVSAQNSRPGAEQQLHQAQDQLNQDYISHADKNFVDSLHSQENDAEEKLAATDPERWQKVLDLLVKHHVDYDALSATALNDTNQIARLLSANNAAAHSRDFAGNTPLHWAVQNNRLPLVSLWIDAGTLLDATNSAGQTALHLAAADGKIEYVKTLLTAQASPSLRDTNGWTPLDAAIQGKQSEVIHILMADNSAPVHPERGFAITLHKAAATGNVAALAALVETETNLEARNELGLTPLQVAVTQGHLAAAALLVDKGVDINVRDPDGNTLLHQIFLQDRFSVRDCPPASWLVGLKDGPHKPELIKYLTVNQNEQRPNEILQGTSFLLACGLDAAATNHAGQTVMQLVTDGKTSRSVFFFDDDQAKLFKLLSTGSGSIEQRDADGNTALHRLCTGFYDVSKVEQMAALIDAGADVNATNNLGQTPLHVAAGNIGGWDGNDPPVNEPFQLLVYKQANVNARDNQGRTPLDVVIASDSSFKREATDLLIKAGAKSNDPDKQGMTPLHLLAASGEPFTSSSMQSLLDSGADPNARDGHGRTSVHLLLTGEWPWHSAGENLQILAKAGADFSAKDDRGRTPLHYLASLKGHDPMFFIHGIGDIFTAAKVDFNARDNDGNTPLHLAAQNESLEVFDWLVKQGANLDATNNAGQTPRLLAANNRSPFAHHGPASAEIDIFQAVRNGKLDAAERLLNADARLANATNQAGITPLRLAAMLRKTNIVEFLEQQGAKWDAVSAVMAGRADVLQKILSQNPAAVTSTANGKDLLHLAAADGNEQTVKLLLAANADPQAADHWGLSPLGRALLKQQTNTVKLLRAHGAKENFFDAVYTGDAQMVSAFLSRDPSLTKSNSPSNISAVEIAAAGGDTELLKLLLKHGGSANVPAPQPQLSPGNPGNPMFRGSGWTPLELATIYNQIGTMEILLRAGAELNQTDRLGFTALHWAVLRGQAKAAALLIQHRADLNKATAQINRNRGMYPAADSQDSIGETPLHLAALLGDTNMVQLLLKSRADVNAVNGMSQTPLDQTTGMPRMIGPSQLMFAQMAINESLEPLIGLNLHPSVFMRGKPENRTVAAEQIRAAGGKNSQGNLPQYRSGFRPF